MPVDSFVSVTVAPGTTAPLWSMTVPSTRDVVPWARAAEGSATVPRTMRTRRSTDHLPKNVQGRAHGARRRRTASSWRILDHSRRRELASMMRKSDGQGAHMCDQDHFESDRQE